MVIILTHLISTTSTEVVVMRNKESLEYSSCRQGAFGTVFDFKERFDMKYEAYHVQGNAKKDDEDVAMFFLQALDNSRYSGFKLSYLNGLTLGSVTSFKNVGDVYIKAVQRLELRKDIKGGGANFSIIKPPRFRAKSKQKSSRDK